jgi:hypothetical protein
VTIGATPAGAQIPGLGDAGGLLNRVPSLSSFLEGDPPITTSLGDARTEIAFLDGWSPAGWQRLDLLPRTAEGAFRLRPGRFAMEAESYCVRDRERPGRDSPHDAGGLSSQTLFERSASG